MTTTCTGCGQQWPRDPRLEVRCPACHASPGIQCRFKAPSGHRRGQAFTGYQPHTEREEAAIIAGFMTRECPANPRTDPSTTPQGQLKLPALR